MSRFAALITAASLGAVLVASHAAGAPFKPKFPPPITLPDIRNGVEYSLAPCSLFAVPSDSMPICEYIGTVSTVYGVCLYGLTPRYWLRSNKGDAWDGSFTWASGNFVKRAGPIACSSPSQTGSVRLMAKPNETLAEVHGYYETDRTKKARASFSGSIDRPAGTTTKLVLALQAQDPTTLAWSDRASTVLPNTDRVDLELVADVEEFTELRVQLRSVATVTSPPKPDPIVAVEDIRLFVGKCIPDMSKPGECLP